jgi:acetoacetyl-CoA synthetase
MWRPSARTIAEAQITAFAKSVGHGDSSYQQLWEWSVQDLPGFWTAIWRHFDVQADGDPSRVLASREMPGARWFPDVTLNFAEHVFRGRPDGALALQHASELQELDAWTWAKLREQTARIAAGLRRLGVGEGDVVAAYLPNVPETVAALLACASLGAVWSCSAPEFGARTVIERFAQVEPKVLLAADGYRYNGRDFDRRGELAQIRAALPGVRHLVLLPHLGSPPLQGSLSWEELTSEPAELTFTRVAFDHPLWVLYSSGTTGSPKAIVHGHGGILLEHLKYVHLHLDARPGDRVLWYTTTGWMMWNFLVGVLLSDASIVLYDGSPSAPTLSRLWQLVGQAGVTHFGTSAGFIAACLKDGVDPRQEADLRALRSVGSTGSPLAREGYRWIYDRLGDEVWLASMSGGTDVCTAFVGGVPTLPVREGEIQARCLGAEVQAFDEAGHPMLGQVGELMLSEPMPSMPIGFWGDPGGQRYRETYFSTFPGVWRHGDWVQIESDGGVVIHGRSDATINRGGVRMGTSEIYSVVLGVEGVLDALVVDVPQNGGGSWMPLFVVLRDGHALDEATRQRIRARIRYDCSPRHVPDEIVAVKQLPRTHSGKLLEVPVKRILAGEPPEQALSRDSLQAPEAIDAFVALAAELAARRRAAARGVLG